MTLKEEISRTIEDMYLAEGDAEFYNQQLSDLERAREEYDEEEYEDAEYKLDRAINEEENQASYFRSVLDDLLHQWEEQTGEKLSLTEWIDKYEDA